MAAQAAPPNITQRVTQLISATLRTVLTVTKKRLMPNRISRKRRNRNMLAGLCTSPRAKLKTASSIKSATGMPSGEAIKSRCLPITSLRNQTKKSAPSARSRKVGLKPIEKGRLAKGSTKTTPHRATKPQCVSARINTPAISAAAAASAASGPATPTKSAISSTPAASKPPSASQRTAWLEEKSTFCALR